MSAVTFSDRTPQADWPAWLAGQVLTAALIAGVGIFSMQFALGEADVPLIWPASGVALAMTYRLGNLTAGTVLIATTVLHLGFDAGVVEALLLGAGTAAAGFAGARLLKRCRFDPHLQRLRDVGLLVAIGGGVTSLVGGLSGALVMVGVSDSLGEIMGICWAADSIGLLLIAPILFAAQVPGAPRAIDAESLLWIGGGGLLVLGVYAGGLAQTMALPLSYLVFPCAIGVALRRSPLVVMLAVGVMAAVALTCTANDKGPFVQAGMPADILSLHAHLAMLALTALILASARAERDAADERARNHLGMLARADRLDAMATMAAGIAHEINQPLCAVSSYAQGARRILREGRPSEELDSALERIVSGNEKASDIVRRVRTFLRSGDENDNRTPQAVDELVADSLALVRAEFRSHGVALAVERETEGIQVDADAVAMRQVLVNLLQNALEAVTAEDGPAQPRVRVVIRRLRWPDRVEVEIVDNGPGLPAGDREALFQPMVTYREGGTGLGLAIARSLVESHYGTLVAEDAAGGGASLRMRLPLTSGQESAGDKHDE